MSTTTSATQRDLSPEGVLAHAAKARGDIFPEWKVLAYASPQTYDLVTHTGGYFHKYHGESTDEQQLSGPMRELIATPALASKGDYRMPRTTFDGCIAWGSPTGSSWKPRRRLRP